MYTIGHLEKKFRISRSTILYYDKLGLLKPSKRAENNYRLYDEQQVMKLNKIILHRKSGITLKNIQKLINDETTERTEILVERLDKMQEEIRNLKTQEKLVLAVLREEVIGGKNTPFTSKTWTDMLIRLGYEEKDWIEWHRQFELDNPEQHHKFLKSLNMGDDEIRNLLTLIREEVK